MRLKQTSDENSFSFIFVLYVKKKNLSTRRRQNIRDFVTVRTMQFMFEYLFSQKGRKKKSLGDFRHRIDAHHQLYCTVKNPLHTKDENTYGTEPQTYFRDLLSFLHCILRV